MLLHNYILELRNKFMAKYFDAKPFHWLINCGLNEEFAEALKDAFPHLQIFSTDTFGFLEDYSESDRYQYTTYGTIDFERLEKDAFWKDKLGFHYASLGNYINSRKLIGFHSFVYDGTYFYDAEVPYGVPHALDLPFFKRQLGTPPTTVLDFYNANISKEPLSISDLELTFIDEHIEIYDKLNEKHLVSHIDRWQTDVANFVIKNYTQQEVY